MEKVKVGIIGASGYAGAELVRLLWNHPYVEVVAISSRSYLGKKISDVYPGFYQICALEFVEESEVIEASDIVFASLPHGLSEHIARACFDAHKVCIDLGADFRLYDEDAYKTWYGLAYEDKLLHEHAVYGLPELFRTQIKDAKIIGNPGCYPTSIALAMYPVLQQDFIDQTSIVIDAKSGTTGAGKGLSEATHYPKCNESFAPYKVASHRHTPEIEQTLSQIYGQAITLSFTPHLLPVNRGIISTIYVNLKQAITLEELYRIYELAYKNEKFVRLLPLGQIADLKYVQYSNYCDISLHLDERNQRFILVSAIDNMVKGAAGQAIQNMNIICGFDEASGLAFIAPSF